MFFSHDALCSTVAPQHNDGIATQSVVGTAYGPHCSCRTSLFDPTPVIDFPNPKDLQRSIIKECDIQLNDWIGSIVLPCTVIWHGCEIKNAHLDIPVDIDICQFFNGVVPNALRLYFSTTDYPPPNDLTKGSSGPHWKRLVHFIERQSYQASSPVICSSGNHYSRRFICQQCNKTNKKRKPTKRNDVEYRHTHLTNDGEKGERENGRRLSRRTSSQNATKHCKFGFTVKWDQWGYYITLARRGGCMNHSNHPKFDTSEIPLPPRLTTNDDKKQVVHLHNT